MSTISPYDEALQFIKQNPGTAGASGLAKLVLSLYNTICGFSFAECVGSLDQHLTSVALRMLRDFADRGETDDLREAGKIIADDLYPGLWEMSVAMNDARAATRSKWEAAELKAERDAVAAAEAALFTDPAKQIAPDTAKSLLDEHAEQYGYYFASGDWRDIKLTRNAVCAAIDHMGGAELSTNCPENGRALAVRIDTRIYYITPDYDAREAYLETVEPPRKLTPLRVFPPHDSH